MSTGTATVRPRPLAPGLDGAPSFPRVRRTLGTARFPTGVDQVVDDVVVWEAEALVTDPGQLWSTCAESLRSQVSEATWKTWFEGIRPMAADERELALTVPSSLVKERIEGRYLSLVEHAVASALGTPVEIRIDVQVDDLHEAPAAPSDDVGDDLEDEEGPYRREILLPPPPTAVGQDEGPLHAKYTFEAFVIGASNRFAHAAALAVAENPARSYNPLFIHGDSGLGKTHLLHAIGNYVRENFPGRHVRYVSTETFMNDFVDAIRTSTTIAFKRRYRECDVLLVDDIQFMENKEGLQEEFFHTFNHLYGANKQMVITSDRPPKSIATLEDRLQSRFLSGLITDVQPPELETRLAILRKKAEGERAHVPDEVLELIATHVKDNIRELEGALIRVTAYASLNREPLTREVAEKVLADILLAAEPRQITPKVILDATSETFGFSVDDLCGTSRRRPLVTARQVGMYVFRELTDFSYPAIAREFGGRDHTTVIHAVEKISALMKERRQIYDQVTGLIQRIKSGV
ncbi:MAG: chromosomal replication initiator protein DnaA [Actinobacteria bacterium]|nr:chromosomal replication initiator protein DnaA [Actinomycetota bacterium]